MISFQLQKHIKTFYNEGKDYLRDVEHNIKLLSIFAEKKRR